MKNKVKKIIKEAVSEALKQSIKEQWNDEKKYYLSQEEKANTIYENVMQRYYGIEYNQYRPVLLKEVTLDRILKKHGTNGFVCISANRSDYPQEVNDKNTKRLIGVPGTEAVIKHGLELISAFLSDYYYTIEFPEMLEELLKYTYENKRKFDIIAALSCCEIGDEALTGITPAKQSPITKDS